jgi:hypothetical protein
MKKILALLALSLMTLTTIAEAGRYGGSFGGRSSFSSSRSYSSPSRSYYRTPRYIAPRPVVIRKTTIVQQNNSTSNGGMGFLGTLIATGAGSYVGNRLAQPSPQPEQAPVYPLCPAVIPAGWNTPCIPQQSKGK